MVRLTGQDLNKGYLPGRSRGRRAPAGAFRVRADSPFSNPPLYGPRPRGPAILNAHTKLIVV